MYLNINKCAIMTFTRRRKFIETNYTINNEQLERTSEYKDLGVLMQSNLKFNSHHQYIVNKAYRALGFIIRNTKNFTNISSIVRLYNALVRPHLEYASSIWSPETAVGCELVERVQKRFLRYLFVRKYNFYPYLVSYRSMLDSFQIQTLSDRRMLSCVIFVFHIVNNIKYKDCHLINSISFNVPKINLRINKDRFFSISTSSCLPFSHVLRQCNIFINKHGIDIFNIRIKDLKKLL